MEPAPLKKQPKHWSKRVALALMLGMLVTGFVFWLRSNAGHKLRSNPLLLGGDVRNFVHQHPVSAPVAYVGLYVAIALCALPVWWLQILAGAGFGLYEGTFFSLIASTIGAGLTVVLARWIAGDWFHQRVEGHMEKLAQLDETFGHNGLLVVMSVRLTHLPAFGLCNYALGLTRVSYRDVVIGTFLGNIPAVAVYVAVGAHYNPLRNWTFDAIIATINILLLLPLILRYLRPEWFRKIGVE